MNEVRFDVVSDPEGDRATVLDILIDGSRIIDLIRAHETENAKREGHLEIAGAYAGIAVEVVAAPSRHLFGEANDAAEAYDGKIALLECSCGFQGCWPLLCRVTVAVDTVTWDQFEQPHRSDWGYDGFGPFVFDRRQYEAAMLALGEPRR